MKTISNKPQKGTSDWFPEEYQIRKYIFDTWRKVCISFGYQEYLTPLIEDIELYKAKSGEDVGGKELMILTDRGGRNLAIRPEMTPSVARLVSRIYPQAIKPLKYFSIANFIRNEKPQRGRNREFWQLNYDIFGSTSLNADIEIMQIGIEIMLAFTPPKNSFVMRINNRKLINSFLLDIVAIDKKVLVPVIRILDKYEKLETIAFKAMLNSLGMTEEQYIQLDTFLQAKDIDALITSFPSLKDTNSLQELQEVLATLISLGYGDWITFSPTTFRCLDYYDGIVFEVFDNNPLNNRSLFGGGRYDGLSTIFGLASFPAVGTAPGDESIRLFLESWNLLDGVKDKKQSLYYIPLLNDIYRDDILQIAQKLRSKGKAVATGFSAVSLKAGLQNAHKMQATTCIIYNEREKTDKVMIVKDMQTGEQIKETVEGVDSLVCFI